MNVTSLEAKSTWRCTITFPPPVPPPTIKHALCSLFDGFTAQNERLHISATNKRTYETHAKTFSAEECIKITKNAFPPSVSSPTVAVSRVVLELACAQEVIADLSDLLTDAIFKKDDAVSLKASIQGRDTEVSEWRGGSKCAHLV